MPVDHPPARSGQSEEPTGDLTPLDSASGVTCANQPDGGMMLSAASLIKIPPFWRENPTLWFSQAEAAFAISRVTSDDTKFRYIILNLDNAALPFVADLLASPPTQNKYEALKGRTLDSFDETQETKLRRLLRGQELGDEKPSNCLHRIKNLAGGQCSETILRTIFMELLPDNIRTILAISEVTDLTKLAMQADKIADTIKSTNVVATLSTPVPKTTTTPGRDQQIEELRAMVETLTKRLNNTKFRSRSRSRYRNPRS